MLKKSIMLPVLAVIAGAAASAFTVNPSSNIKGGDTEYWYSNFPGPLHYDGVQTKQSEEMITGCQDQAITTCARGYLSSQLSDPSDPAAGPADPNTYDENLNKSN